MKAEINADGHLHVRAETPTEAFALERIAEMKEGDGFPVIIDCRVLNPIGHVPFKWMGEI